MAKLKKTKNELKAQREALRRYERFLPTLELKKQQLQREVRRAETALRESAAVEEAVLARLRPWAKLLSAAPELQLGDYVRVAAVDLDTANIAGVNVPVLANLRFESEPVDYFETPAWLEDAVAALSEVTRLRVGQLTLERQRDLLGEELRITAQRVNLFEKVMIPRAQECIRSIRIALGDAQTAAVARAKIAKGKGAELLSGSGA
jgi:V/A-type H+/Na+-transporting ATPase subunit D